MRPTGRLNITGSERNRAGQLDGIAKMKIKWLIVKLCFLFCLTARAETRNWIDVEGKKFKAEIVLIHSNKTVTLKPVMEKSITIPFSTLIPEDEAYLENLLLQERAEKLHPVLWDKMNTLFGMKIWQDECLWDDITDLAAKRMKLIKESQTAFIENHRTYPQGKENILQEPVYATVLYGDHKCVGSLLFVFYNQGDCIPRAKKIGETVSRKVVDEANKKIKDSYNHLYNVLTEVLGEPERYTIGKHALRENVCRWDWNEHAILLVMQKEKYTVIRILPSGRVGEVEKISRIELAKKMSSCVERHDNGDVLIKNIPMINQGPKGYCVPATYERYCRYLGVPVDLYLLANLANTKAGGGTSFYKAEKTAEEILSNHGIKLKRIGYLQDIQTLTKYIDQGIPILWGATVTSVFERNANENTAHRNGKEIDADKKEALIRSMKDELKLQRKNQISKGHLRLIIGYNEKSQEIAFSDSWGPKYSARWISLDLAITCTGQMTILK
jgi:hypothetical protein